MLKIRNYKKEFDYSYVLGPFPTLELVEESPEVLEHVFISPDFNEIEKVVERLEELNISYSIDQKTLNRIATRKKEYMAGVFKKYKSSIKENENHILLDSVSDMGNLGTIIRTMVGFGYKNLALIGNCCDIFNPKVVRGSMGSFFKINFEEFESLEEYKSRFDNQIYAFMLNETSVILNEVSFKENFSLAFGNEGSGLGVEYESEDIHKVIIPQSDEVDSLNLTIACAVSMYEAKKSPLK